MVSVAIKGLTKRFGSNPAAVYELDLAVQTNEFLTLLGPSGCGKSTTLRCIAGLERPESGEIVIDGETVVSTERGVFVPPEKRQTGMVFQSYALWPHMSVFSQVAYPLRRNRKVARRDIAERVDAALSSVGLDSFASRGVNELSGGQQQRVALARAMVGEPRLVLYDEPLSNLDAQLRSQMRAELRRVHRTMKTTSIYVTHDQSEAMALSDRIVVLESGCIQQIGTPAEVFRRPANEFVARFIGYENFFHGTVTEIAGCLVSVLLEPSRSSVVCTSSDADEVGPGSPVRLAVRSSSYEFCSESDCDHENRFNGEIRDVTFLGDTFQYQVETDLGAIVLQVPESVLARAGRGTPDVGEATSVHVNANRVALI